MNNIDHHTSFYRLLPSFLKDAEKLGFIRTLRQWSVIYYMLENIDDTSRLKYSLSPVLCTSPDQQAEFYKLYDHWFIELAVGLQEEKNTASSSDSVGPSAPERKQDTDVHPIVPFCSNVNDQKNGLRWWQWLLVFVPLSIPAIVTVALLGWSNPFSIIVLVLLFLSSIWVIRRWKNRKLVVRQERTDRGDTFWNFYVPPHRLIAFGPEFKRLSTRLRERVPGKVSRLDTRITVRKTALANGFLSLQFRVNKEIPCCLMLIDLSNDNNHRAALFDAFYFWLKDNDVPVVRFYFRSIPNLLWNEDTQKGIPLATLAARYAGSRLFLLGDGWRLLNAETGEPNESAQIFRSWNDRVLITPIPFPQWTGRERSLESLFVIAPFTADGLKIIEKHLNPEEPYDWELQRPDYWHEEAILFDETALPDSLYTHFSDPAMLEWLAALSFYPELNWNLTLFLGDLIGKLNGRSLLTFENLRQLSRIYWFYNGFIPTRAREALYKILKDQKEKTQIIHARIAEILEEQLKHKEEYYSADRNSLYLQILLHKAHAGVASATEIKELRKLAKETKEDFLITRYTSRPKPWEWVLPSEFSFLVPKKEEIKTWFRDFSNTHAKMKEGIIPGFENAEHYVEDETKEVAQIQPESDVNLSIDNTKGAAAADTILPSDEGILNARPLKVFIVYARADAQLKDELLTHLHPFVEYKFIEKWVDSDLLPGEDWEKRIEDELEAAHLVIMLVSVDALNSEFIRKKELKIALEKKRAETTRFVPILVRDCFWKMNPDLSEIELLPKDEYGKLKSVTAWLSRDSAWLHCCEELHKIILEIRSAMAKRVSISTQKVVQEVVKQPNINRSKAAFTGKSDYEFFKGPSGWNIRFNGKLIDLSGRNTKGLSFIHTLLSHPNVPFHAFELDPLEQSIDKSIKMNLEESLSVSIDSKYSDLSVQNEPEILQALKHLERDKPEEAPTEEYIFYLSQMKYLLYQMKIIRSKKEYSNLYNIISDTLEEVIRQFSAEKDDEALVKRVINIAGVIGKSNENSLEIERARQRVTKNISNAINSIQDIDCRSFFKNNLKIGFSSEYTPPSNFRHEWVLYTEE